LCLLEIISKKLNKNVKKLDQEELENNLDYQEMKNQMEKNNLLENILN
jgi:hypothetical protein